MFDGFTQTQIQTSDPQVAIHLRYGGHGPPLLLLHGNPLTHVHWHLVAPQLAKDFTVVAADLRGYGDSGKPRGLPDHSNYSFRRMAQDQVEVMAASGLRPVLRRRPRPGGPYGLSHGARPSGEGPQVCQY